MKKKVSATQVRRQEQFFALIDQVQERTRQEPVAELENAIAEAMTAAKQAEYGVTRQLPGWYHGHGHAHP